METKREVVIYGAGCDKFFQTVKSFGSAARKCSVKWDVKEVTDGKRIVAKGALKLPAVFMNERLVSQGEGISEERAAELLRQTV